MIFYLVILLINSVLGQWGSGAPTDVTLDPRWRGLSFNGSTFVNMSGFNLNGTSFTVEALIQPTNIDGDKCVFGVDSTTAMYGLHLVLRGGVVYMGFYGSDTSGATVVQLGKWAHVAFRYNLTRKEQSVFLNGVLDGKNAGRNPLLGTIPMSYNIGKCLKTTSNAFLGKIAYVRVWGTARTDLEISTGIWSTPSGNGLIAAYEFDQTGTTTNVIDQTGLYNGKLYLGNWYLFSSTPAPCGCSLPSGKCPTSIFETLCDCARDPTVGYWAGDTCKSCLKLRDTCDGYEGTTCTDRCVSRTSNMVDVSIASSVVTAITNAFPEGKPVNSSFLNYTNINLRCLTECRLNISFLYEGASYHNSLGYFTYDPKTMTVIKDVVIIPDASLGSSSNCVKLGTSVLNIGPFPAETHIGFWIWSDAFCNPSRNNGTKMYSIPSLNKDKFNHLAVMPYGDTLVLGFEDISGLGDKDYNDVMLVANISGILASNALPPVVPQSYLSDVILVVPNNCFISATDYQYLSDFIASFAGSRLPTLGLIVYNSEAKVLTPAGTVDKTSVLTAFKAEAKCGTQGTTCCTSLTFKAYKLAETEFSKLDNNRNKLLIVITDVGTIPQTNSSVTVNTGTSVVQSNPNITVVTIAIGTTIPSAEVIVSKPENARLIPSYSELSKLVVLTETSPSQVCTLGAWSAWSECTVACGGGTRSRNRTVVNQDPKYTPCPGEVETAQCNTQACCTVGEWSSWSVCSKQCDGGVSSRTRTVTKGADSAVCPNSRDEQACNTQVCCQYGEWSIWSACSVDCNGGTSVSTRVVTLGAPTATCESSSRTQSCNTQLCCSYGDWSSWGECSAKCDGGSQISTRKVNIGAVTATCESGVKTQSCNTQKCCDYGTWSTWSACSKDCDAGTQTQTRSLVKGSPDVACDAPTLNSQSCNTQACCSYSEWGAWSVCSKLCDGGVQSRKRTVTKGASSAVCETDTQEQTCNSSPCCTYGAWGDWQQCSAVCDGGVRVKTRNVIKASELVSCDPSSQTEPCGLTPCCTYGSWSAFSACSAGCDGGSQSRTRTVTKATPDTTCETSQESQTCNTVKCCTYGDWSQWGECSAVCDGGVRKQTRTLTKGSSDAQCTETTEKSEACGSDPCCVYGEWSGWSSCSAVCGGGVITRTRSLTKKSATASCLPTSESQPCNSQNCCLFTEWSEWTKCSATCGGGVQKRSRSLLVVSNVVCPGASEETQSCGTIPCTVDCSTALTPCDCLAIKSSGCGWEAGTCKLGEATDCYECNQPGCSCGQVQTPCACAALTESGCGWSDFGVCKTGEFTTCDECPKKCGGCDCDVVTIVDASCSISPDLWPRVSDWAQQIVNATTGKGGIVVYTHKPWISVPLTSDKASIVKGLNAHSKCYFNQDGSPNPCCGTNTDLALKAGADLLAQSTSKCKTLVLITDGVSSFHERTMAIAPTFKSLYPSWNIWAVAVGKRASYSELLAFVRNINDIAPFESSKVDYIAQCQDVGVGCAAAKTPCDCLALKNSGCGWSRQGICKLGAATDCYECGKEGCTCDAKSRCSCVALKELGCGWQSDPGFCGTGWGVTSSFGC